MRYLTIEELEAGLKKWQAILHLQDWEITVELVPQSHFAERTQSASASIKSFRRGAHIRLASLETMDLVAHPLDADMERSLVHELVHLVFLPEDLFESENLPAHRNRAYEIAVESMSRVLVELDRIVPAAAMAVVNYGGPR